MVLTRGYWLADTACTQALWSAVMDGDRPSRFQGEDRPVETVSWNDVQSFVARANDRVPGLALTLPSEAQWEYACRAGSESAFSFGDQVTTDDANYNGNYPMPGGEKGDYRQETLPVRRFRPNPWGLYQMHGNVWEWCRDAMREYRDEVERDPVGDTGAGASRAVRGGSWIYGARDVRSAYRVAGVVDFRNFDTLVFVVPEFKRANAQAAAERPSPLQMSRRQRAASESGGPSRRAGAAYRPR